MAARPDWENRFKQGLSLLPEIDYLNETEAQAGLAVFDRLKVPDVFGCPPLYEACGQWFREFVYHWFGSYDPKKRIRHLSEFFILVPKKNGKTSYSAAVMITHMIRATRPNSEFYLVAPTREISSISYQQAVHTIQADPTLEKLFHIRNNVHEIVMRTGLRPKLKIISADTKVTTGVKPAGVLVDETHEFVNRGKAKEIFIQLRGGMASKEDGFFGQITTQSAREPTGIFWRELNNARMVRDGKIDQPLLPILYEWPDDMLESEAWKDEKNWHLVNPNMGRSVSVSFLRREFSRVSGESKDDLNLFASQHLNVQIGVRLAGDWWPAAEDWPAAANPNITYEYILNNCGVVVLGIDGGGKNDLLGLSVLGREKGTDIWLAKAHAWAQPSVLERNPSSREQLELFAERGHLTICKHPRQAIEDVADVAELMAPRLPRKHAIGIDPCGVGAIIHELRSRPGIEDSGDKQITWIPQGWRLYPAMRDIEFKLMDLTFYHCGSPLMAWCVGNAKMEQRGNSWSMTKDIAQGKIDPVIALLTATMIMREDPPEPVNVYGPEGRDEFLSI